jgi:hypothetical protein
VTRRQLRLAEDFDPEINFPFCKLVMANLGMRVDRLPPIRQMALKVGSMIGFEWRFRILSEVFPLEHFKPTLLPVRLHTVAFFYSCCSQFLVFWWLLQECLSLEKSHFLHSRMVAPPAGQGTDREVRV